MPDREKAGVCSEKSFKTPQRNLFVLLPLESLVNVVVPYVYLKPKNGLKNIYVREFKKGKNVGQFFCAFSEQLLLNNATNFNGLELLEST